MGSTTGNLENRLKRIEQRVAPPAHPLLDDPAIIRHASDLAHAYGPARLMGLAQQEALAARDADQLRRCIEREADLCRILERMRQQEEADPAYKAQMDAVRAAGQAAWRDMQAHGELPEGWGELPEGW